MMSDNGWGSINLSETASSIYAALCSANISSMDIEGARAILNEVVSEYEESAFIVGYRVHIKTDPDPESPVVFFSVTSELGESISYEAPLSHFNPELGLISRVMSD